MRLNFVTHSLPPDSRPASNVGGMQRVAMELDKEFSKVATLDYSRIAMRSSWALTHVRILPFLANTYRKLRSAILNDKVDVVLFSSMVTATLVLPLSRYLAQSSVKTAAIVHGLDVTTPVSAYQSIVRKVFARVDAVLPVSSATGEVCVERGLPPERVWVVPNGIDVTRFNAPADRRQAKRTLTSGGIGPEELLLLSVGRLVERKGFEWFVSKVMPLLPENVHYWIAGEGPEQNNIEQAIADNNLSDRVKMIGLITDVELANLYAGSDLFIMPNRPVANDMEGFGIVILEAGLSGTPAIAARLEGIKDVIAEEKSGHYVESGDAQAFAQLILKYSNDPVALDDLSKEAARYTKETFSWTSVSKKYLSTLDAIR